MKALSIRQPWPWLIIRPDLVNPEERSAAFAAGLIKDIENREWITSFRGRILIHASKGMTRDEYEDAAYFAAQFGIDIPLADQLQRGGIVGSVEITDCVDGSDSIWFIGRFGLVLRDSKPLPFVPYKGKLGLFEIDEAALTKNCAGEKYRPSNGTEGEIFTSAWCCKCARDKSMREGKPFDECDDEEVCPIIANTFAFDVSDPEYPSEWTYGADGQPCCTAYVYPGDAVPRPRCELTIDMFEAQP